MMKMNPSRTLALLLFFCASGMPLSAEITLGRCQELARMRYPAIREYALIDEAEKYSLETANAVLFPRLSVSAKTTWQSEVATFPVELPGMRIDPPSAGQYQILGEINQTIWDGGAAAAQKKLTRASSAADRRRLDAELYALRDRVNQVFFGILLLDEQTAQNELLIRELDTNYRRVDSLLANGVASRSDLDAVLLEKLAAVQTRDTLRSTRNSYALMLARMTGTETDGAQELVRPDAVSGGTLPVPDGRPELLLYRAQLALNDGQKDVLVAGTLPKVSAFVQGGYGLPGLDMFDPDPAAFYLAGLRFSWPLDGFYALKAGLDRIAANGNRIRAQEDAFRYNTELGIIRANGEIASLKAQIAGDSEMIILRERIKDATAVKLENGSVPVTDLLREITAENAARQKKALHEAQLMLATYNLKFQVNTN